MSRKIHAESGYATEPKPRAMVVIGAGHHARRIYIPELIERYAKSDMSIVIVDLYEAAQTIGTYLIEKDLTSKVEAYYLNSSDVSLPFAKTWVAKHLLQNYDIEAVIISTDPTHHVEYAAWALKNNLHILMDKPVSAHDGSVSDPKAYKMLERDYADLMKQYKKSHSLFCLSTQRRYESGYNFVFERLSEVADLFNVPVTSVQAFHSDGLWIFPDEIMYQKMHPYNTGYGKLSHSGFHILDIIWQLYVHGTPIAKKADSFGAYASAIYPTGYMQTITTDDYERYFGKHTTLKTTRAYQSSMRDFGEIDMTASITLKKHGNAMSLISLNLLHSSFSKRSWRVPSKDLYKGNGRVKHQLYIIEQGPFQCIQIHNYQSDDEHDNSDDGDTSYALGGKNHFDIHIFRNTKMFPHKVASLEKYSSQDIDARYRASATKLSNELAKHHMITDFLDSCALIRDGKATRDTVAVRNKIDTYATPVSMMSALYESLVLQKSHKSPSAERKI